MNPTHAPRISTSSKLLKSITSAIHPPLPLTPRESDALLRTVQDSFRRQLIASEESTLASAHDPRAPYSSPNAHLGNVLKMAPFSPSLEEARKQRERRIKLYLVDPIAVFEEHVALGTASIDLARSCLARYNDCRKDMDTQLGGSRVLKGLVTAELLERPSDFLNHGALSFPLMVALAGESKYSLLIGWILKKDCRSGLTRQFIRHVEKRFGLEWATRIFFEFYTQISRLPQIPPHLGMVGRELCKAAKKSGELPASQFERLLFTSKHWALSRFEYAMIQLRFGNSVQPGLDFFAAIDAKPTQWWTELPEKQRQKYTQMGIELADQCLRQGKLEGARAVAAVVSKRFPDQLGDRQVHQLVGDDGLILPRGEVAEHLDVFREMFKETIHEERAAAV